MAWNPPDPTATFFERQAAVLRLEKAPPDKLAAVKAYYRANPWDFISDWGVTFDPREMKSGRNPVLPFVLWDRQVDYLKWLHARRQADERGLVEKSRDCGVSWLSVAYAGACWLFEPGFVARFGSRKEDLVDRRGDMDSLFEKAWFFLTAVPRIFRPDGFSAECRAHLRIVNPDNGAALIGEAGDNIGRGGRSTIAFVDEAAFVERQELVDAALSQTTNCQIDISTPNGSGNAFYEKRQRYDGTERVFIFDWRDDPRKDNAWYQRQREDLDEVIVAQEIDRDYEASQEDAFIPASWVRACLDAHVKLGLKAEGIRTTGFDPADTGDGKAIVNRHGSIIVEAEEKTTGEIPEALHWAYQHADDHRADLLIVDGDGMGAAAMKVSLETKSATRYKVKLFRGSGAVREPGKSAGKRLHREGKSNVDTYENFRAQAWTWLRERCEATYNAVMAAEQGAVVTAKPEDLLSISSDCRHANQLITEMSRPLRVWSKNGKIQVEAKDRMKARGVRSPNLADAAVMAFSESRIEADESPAEEKRRSRKRVGGSRGWMAR